jgi:hypothetical protein
MVLCRDNVGGICKCKCPKIGSNCTCLAYIPLNKDEKQLQLEIDTITQELWSQLGISEDILSESSATAIATRMRYRMLGR